MLILSFVLLLVEYTNSYGPVSLDTQDIFYPINKRIQKHAPSIHQVSHAPRIQPTAVSSNNDENIYHRQLDYPFGRLPKVSPQSNTMTMDRYGNLPQKATTPSTRIDGKSDSSLPMGSLDPAPRRKSRQTDSRKSLRELQISERKCDKFNEPVFYIQVVGGTPADPGEFVFMLQTGHVSFDPQDIFYSLNGRIQKHATPFHQVSHVPRIQPSAVPSYNDENIYHRQLGYPFGWLPNVAPQINRMTMDRYRNPPQKATTPSTRIDDKSNSSLPLGSLDPVPRIKSGETDSRASLRELQISERKCDKFNEPVFYIQVVGGTPADPGEFVFMAALGWDTITDAYDYKCGGTLIAEDYVLTAAHCTSLYGRSPTVVKLGGGNLMDEADGETVRIQRIILHPDYTEESEYNDIALLKLEKQVSIKPACLWTQGQINRNQVRAIGYGHTVFAGPISNQLLKVNLTLFSNNVCNQFYRPNTRIESGIVNSQICAGDPKYEKDTCQGDSGGPLLIENLQGSKKISYVVGVTSIGLQCAGRAPSVYVRISSYIDWIESVVWPNGV